MIALLAFVCFFSSLGGILVAQSYKAMLVFKIGLEASQKRMFTVGLASLAVAVLLALLGFALS